MLTNLLTALKALGAGLGVMGAAVLVVFLLLAADNYSF